MYNRVLFYYILHTLSPSLFLENCCKKRWTDVAKHNLEDMTDDGGCKGS